MKKENLHWFQENNCVGSSSGKIKIWNYRDFGTKGIGDKWQKVLIIHTAMCTFRVVTIISKYLDNKGKNPKMSDLNFVIKGLSLP